jgi:plasmid stabilization system protein ParE
MRKVIWLAEAVDDLIRLREFIGDKSRKAAQRMQLQSKTW